MFLVCTAYLPKVRIVQHTHIMVQFSLKFYTFYWPLLLELKLPLKLYLSAS